MSQPLEVTEYDVIILGTGLVESILAGALARIGKSVLHLDANGLYGGNWCSLNFRELLDWVHNMQDPPNPLDGDDQESIEGMQALSTNFPIVRQQAYSTLEYEIYSIVKSDDVSQKSDEYEGPSNSQSELVTDANSAKIVPDYDALARYLLNSEESEQNDAIAKVITEQFKSKILDRTRENEEAIAVESSRLSHLLQLHKDSENISEETVRHVSTSLSNFERIETLATLLNESKKYNLDLVPKMLPCRGEFIDTLISSGVSRYLDFKAMDKTYIYSDGTFDKVPCSKDDVFTSQTISFVEKRTLMRFLTFALDYSSSPEVYSGFEEKSYVTFLREKFNIEGKLLSAVLYAISLIQTEESGVNTMQGLEKTQRYLKSLGRYGNSAFLVALYGSVSEIAQGFCRICAVYGGIYMLDHPVKYILINENSNKFSGLVDVNDQQLSSTFLVATIDYLPTKFIKNEKWELTSRAIVITDKFIHEESGDVTMTVFPPDKVNNRYPINVLQFSAGTQTCPADKYVLYLSTKACGRSAKEDLINALEKLINIPTNDNQGKSTNEEENLKSNPLFALFYRYECRVFTPDLPDNIIVADDPNSSLDCESAMILAKKHFERMCPNEEFFPPGPDPDEDEFNLD
ncbi:1098_t:CDS:10 [Acaulospora morrowiae]|uniref:Rab escort protein 1 n=1 Tax=Acaulospora morrowiae TaxID=94023 RepID=A0A9N8YMF2_9GLOM|nr:1098_t:CDS:10 [Acaulospora morrowiae]